MWLKVILHLFSGILGLSFLLPPVNTKIYIFTPFSERTQYRFEQLWSFGLNSNCLLKKSQFSSSACTNSPPRHIACSLSLHVALHVEGLGRNSPTTFHVPNLSYWWKKTDRRWWVSINEGSTSKSRFIERNHSFYHFFISLISLSQGDNTSKNLLISHKNWRTF